MKSNGSRPRARRALGVLAGGAFVAAGLLLWRAVPVGWQRWQCEAALDAGRLDEARARYAALARWRGADEVDLLDRLATAIVLARPALRRAAPDMDRTDAVIRLAGETGAPALLAAIEPRAGRADGDGVAAAGALARAGREGWRERLRELLAGDHRKWTSVRPPTDAIERLEPDAAQALAELDPPDPAALAWARAVADGYRSPQQAWADDRRFASTAAFVLGRAGDEPLDVTRILLLERAHPGLVVERRLAALAHRAPTREAASVALLVRLGAPERRELAALALLEVGAISLDELLAIHAAQDFVAGESWLERANDVRMAVAISLDAAGDPRGIDDLLAWRRWPRESRRERLRGVVLGYLAWARPGRLDPRLARASRESIDAALAEGTIRNPARLEQWVEILGRNGDRDDLPSLARVLHPDAEPSEPLVFAASAAVLRIVSRSA